MTDKKVETKKAKTTKTVKKVVKKSNPEKSVKKISYSQHALLKFFKYEHLPEHLQTKSKLFHDLAVEMDKSVVNSSEKTAGLRKLLEAKDCFVRAAI